MGLICAAFELDRIKKSYSETQECVQAAETEIRKQRLRKDEQETERLIGETEQAQETEAESQEEIERQSERQLGQQQERETETETETQGQTATEQETDETQDSAAEETEEKILPESVRLNVEVIFQEPELPTGCESVALTMALNSLGFSLEKTEIADHYLVYDAENLARGYVGDPYSYYGAGVFPPGLAQSANRFLQEQDTDLRAQNITGTQWESLYAYLAEGYPVLIWTTMYYGEPQLTDAFSEYEGIAYQWYENEHCVVLGGYDLTQNTATLFDSLQGEIVIDVPTIEAIYDAVGRCAVVIC